MAKKLATSAQNQQGDGSGKFALLLAAVFCASLALNIGFFEPEFGFQKASAQVITRQNCTMNSSPSEAFAQGGRALLFLPKHPDFSVFAALDGTGEAGSTSVNPGQDGTEIKRLLINGERVCSPCEPGKSYPVAAGEGRLEIMVEGAWNEKAGAPAKSRLALFEQLPKDYMETPALLVFEGSWKFAENAAIPSSFYNTDAPFHIDRARELQDYLRRLEWPWDSYSFMSSVPSAAISMASGIEYQYAQKAYGIALFFAPVLLFYFFSRKLRAGRDSAFLFSSLIYLCLPPVGYPTGGGADLFLYGMLPHTLATYFSLAFFYFAHEYAIEGKKQSFLPALALFALCAVANQRMLLPLCVMLAVLAAAAAPLRALRRTAVLSLACASLAVWAIAPFLSTHDLGEYGPLLGAKAGGLLASATAAFQAGYLLVPPIAALGFAVAFQRKETIPVLLGFAALAILVAVSDEGLNARFPFIDGVRFLPSFFLPAFFLFGIGAAEIRRLVMGRAEEFRRASGMDVATFSVAFALAVLVPCCALLADIALGSSDQYRGDVNMLFNAAEYQSLARAYSIAGSERAVFVSRGMNSAYPVLFSGPNEPAVVFFKNSSALASHMEKIRAKYAIFGNFKHLGGENESGRLNEYQSVAADSRFEDGPYAGIMKLAVLKTSDAPIAKNIYGQNATIEASEVRHDRVRISGTCEANLCELLAFYSAPPKQGCSSSQGSCSAILDADSKGTRILGITRGRFEISTFPAHQEYEPYLALLCASVIAACGIAALKL